MRDDNLNKLYDFLAERSPVPLNNILGKAAIIFSLFLAVYLLVYGIRGLANKRITVRFRGLSREEFTGNQAVRISIYYLIMAAIVILVILNVFIQLSIIMDPLQIHLKTYCVWNCG